VFVERDALLERGLASHSLALPVEPLADEQIADLIAAHDVVLTV
jgi:sulfur relay (sulfurtransferase) DsrF/TusC family protein